MWTPFQASKQFLSLASLQETQSRAKRPKPSLDSSPMPLGSGGRPSTELPLPPFAQPLISRRKRHSSDGAASANACGHRRAGASLAARRGAADGNNTFRAPCNAVDRPHINIAAQFAVLHLAVDDNLAVANGDAVAGKPLAIDNDGSHDLPCLVGERRSSGYVIARRSQPANFAAAPRRQLTAKDGLLFSIAAAIWRAAQRVRHSAAPTAIMAAMRTSAAFDGKFNVENMGRLILCGYIGVALQRALLERVRP